jgi:hypothetical protein
MSEGGSVSQDAQERYRRAVELAAAIRVEWEELGCPLTTEGGATGRAVVPHPLVKMMAEADRDADRFARPLKKAHDGPAPRAVVQAKIGKSPRQKLRAVR